MLLGDDLLQARSPGVNFYVLRDTAGLYLIDAGFIGGASSLRRALRKSGWGDLPILGIIITHGHLDHILNVGRIVCESGAWVAAPRLDLPHYAGPPSYKGASKVTGCLEAIGRPLLGFTPFTPDRLLDDGDTLDIWHELTVVHLPGHTAGHCGFYCEKRKLLFSADLFASFEHFSHLPPAIFNTNGSQIPESVRKALALDLVGVLPNHADRVSPQEHLERLRKIGDKLGRLTPPPSSAAFEDVRVIFSHVTEGDPDKGLVPGYHFRIQSAAGEDVGHINFRVGDTEHVRKVAGHIGFEIQEDHRGHGYAGKACMALGQWIATVIPEVVITADPDNTASIRTIEWIGATYLDEVDVPVGDPHYRRGSRRKKRFLWAPGTKKNVPDGS